MSGINGDKSRFNRLRKQKIQRRIPSSADVGFAVFGNDHLVPTLTHRMKDAAGRQFRDGLNYQHNLTAVRNANRHR